MDEEDMETRRTSEKAKKGEPDRDTMEEKVRMDRGQEEFMTKKDITLDKVMKTLLVITAMEKGKPKAIDVSSLQSQGMRCTKTTYVRPPVDYKSRMMRAVWGTMKNLYRLREASILCTQAASTLFKVNGSQVKDGAPNRIFDSLKSRMDSAGTWRLWTERSKKPTTRRSCSDYLGTSRPRTRGKRRRWRPGLVSPGPRWRRSESGPARPAPRWRRLSSTRTT